MEKYCSKCGMLKKLHCFHKNKNKKDGHQDFCKECRKNHYIKNKEIINEYKKEWYNNNRSSVIKRVNKYYHNNSEEININRREKYNNDDEYRDIVKSRNKETYDNNKEKYKEINKKWIKKNYDKYRVIQKNYYHNNKHVVSWRRLLKRTVKMLGQQKNDTTINLLGYSPKDLKEYLESLFTEGMSWENHGKWHIDHIKPLSSFNEDTHPSIVNALSNLQPLWAEDNLSKSNKIF